jgi:DNA-directed RNA polymerase specialized sigma24 family protein
VSSATDQQLLREYAEHRSEDAFAELVGRHLDFVYSAALRMTGDPASAEDVAQGVSVVLMEKAG